MFYFFEIVFILAPTYVWRFALGGIPVNFLEILILIFWAAFAIWLWKTGQVRGFVEFQRKQSKTFWIIAALFLIAAFISTAISPDKSRAAGQLIAFFIEPLGMYIVASYLLKEEQRKIHFLKLVLVLIGIFGAYGILQYFTRIGLPAAWWGNANEPKRALSIFEYPNAFALYLAPLMALCLPFLFDKGFSYGKQAWLKWLLFLLALGGLLVSLSRGGWLGFAAAAAVVIFFQRSNKMARRVIGTLGIIAIILIVAVPNLRYRVILPFAGEKSSVSRFSLWHTADKMIKSSPVFGKGLFGFATKFNAYNTDPNLQPLNYPHNIFLNFWVETGLLGLLSFFSLCIFKAHAGWKRRDFLGIALMAFLAAVIVHGLVDAPYFKNDLALIFWCVIALV